MGAGFCYTLTMLGTSNGLDEIIEFLGWVT